MTTNFVFSVSATNSPQSRQTSGNTQATSSDGFRGIVDGSLLAFTKGSPVADGKWIPSSATQANKEYGLGTVMTTSDALTDGSMSHRVLELALPLETNTLMFYGRAPKSGADEHNAQGKISYTLGQKDLTAARFSLTRKVESSQESAFNQYQNLMSAVLNHICASELADATVNYDGATYTGINVKWTHYVTISSDGKIRAATKAPLDGAEMSPLGEILADALVTLATLDPDEIRAGSGAAIARTIGDLVVVLNKVHDAVPSSKNEAIAQALANRILNHIGSCFDVTTPPTLAWKSAGDVKDAISYSGSIDKVVVVTTGTVSALSEFPDVSFGVPKGCAQLKVTTGASTDTEGQVTTPGSITWSYSASTPLLSTAGTSIFSIYYPAEICYFGNSPIRVTEDAHTEADYPQGVANWDNDDSWKAGATGTNSQAWTKNGHVVSTTRSVAMQYNINYGSALLKTTVDYATGLTSLKDNNHAIQLAKNPSLGETDEPDAEVPIKANGIKLKGILIGGQPETVGWDYTPVSGSTFDHVVYDKAIVSDAIPTTGVSDANYTLVWDNWDASKKGQAQSPVYVCLELENNTGVDFWGNKNIVRNGGTFYLVGKLDPDAGGLSATDRSEGITWPSAEKQALPPYDTDGNTIQERRIFMQDFMTSANFVIGVNSLKYAYVTVPDLRSTQISLGLSVDLKWQTGLVFDNVILGGN
ncbi:MAG: hypothetical protein IJ692_03935 [Alloprevotella sp.]|nr:hypothetical protein [Alloprevotella sp.]